MEYDNIKIAFDGRIFIHDEIRGISRYTFELIRALKKTAGDRIAFYSFSPEPMHAVFQEELNLKQIVFSAKREILWEQYELPRKIKENRMDVFHATHNRGLPLWRACKLVLTCHDIIENLPGFNDRRPLKPYMRQRYADLISIYGAHKIITVSEHSKKDICKFWKVPEKKVEVIYEAANERFLCCVGSEQILKIKEKYQLPSVYLLYLGGFDRKKNLPGLVKAYKEISEEVPHLVLAGDQKGDFALVEKLVNDFGLAGRIHFPGKIADEDLPGLYQGALAFIYPSLYEGFGLQLVEAMASGIPVLASERTSLPEVLGGAGLLFNPEDPQSLAKQLKAVSFDAGLRNILCQKSKDRASHFSWEKTARQTLEVYLKVLAKGTR